MKFFKDEDSAMEYARQNDMTVYAVDVETPLHEGVGTPNIGFICAYRHPDDEAVWEVSGMTLSVYKI